MNTPTNEIILCFELLKKTKIKKEKQWTQLIILNETILIFDDKSVATFYLDNGKVKNKYKKLYSAIKETILIVSSLNGSLLCGILESGDIFFWKRNPETLITVKGLLQFCLPSQKINPKSKSSLPHLNVTENASIVFVITLDCQVFIWQRIKTSNPDDMDGLWSNVKVADHVQIPSINNMEKCVHSVFILNDNTFGFHNISSIISTDSNSLHISTLLLKFTQTTNYSASPYTASWHVQVIDNEELLGHKVLFAGAANGLIARHSKDGQLLAVVVNQFNVASNKLVVVSPLLDFKAKIVDILGSTIKLPTAVGHLAKSHWVVDIDWILNDLFIVLLTGQGSLSILSRMGEQFLIQIQSHETNSPPLHFLSLFPLSPLRYIDQSSEIPASTQQYFSLCIHPDRVLFLVSDGISVSAIQLHPNFISTADACISFMRLLASSIETRLNCISNESKLVSSVTSNHQKSPWHRGLLPAKPQPQQQPAEPQHFETSSLTNSVEEDVRFSDEDHVPVIFETFTSAQSSNQTQSTDLQGVKNNLSHLSRDILLAWSLAASHVGLWTIEHEDITNIIVSFLTSYYHILLSNKEIKINAAFYFLYECLNILKLDSQVCNLSICSINLVDKFFNTTLKLRSRKWTRIHQLHGCYLILKRCETILSNIYNGQHVQQQQQRPSDTESLTILGLTPLYRILMEKTSSHIKRILENRKKKKVPTATLR